MTAERKSLEDLIRTLRFDNNRDDAFREYVVRSLTIPVLGELSIHIADATSATVYFKDAIVNRIRTSGSVNLKYVTNWRDVTSWETSVNAYRRDHKGGEDVSHATRKKINDLILAAWLDHIARNPDDLELANILNAARDAARVAEEIAILNDAIRARLDEQRAILETAPIATVRTLTLALTHPSPAVREIGLFKAPTLSLQAA